MSVILIIVLTLMAEAGSETTVGREAVASVIWHRAHERNQYWEDVCLAPKQFSCWNDAKPTKQMAAKWKKERPELFEECMLVAESMVTYKFKPVVKANHFYNPDLAQPDWADKLKDKQTIGRHVFGRL
jgi:spore germination cell wall hydrolase CwlJ-like protein